MRTLLSLFALLTLLASCASFDGRGLVPGQSTLEQVEALMGPADDRRVQPNGETWLYFSRQPYGRATYVARIAPDGVLLELEQRLSDENLKSIQAGKSTQDDVRNLFGPPWTVTQYPRMQRETWEYRMRTYGTSGLPMILYVQFSPDRVVREVYELSEDNARVPFFGFGF